MRRAATFAASLLAAMAILAGCGGSTDGSAHPAPSDPSAQSDLRPPVSATASEPAAPVSVTAGGSTADVDAVATDAQGALYPPTDVSRVGWWVDSSLPGSGSGAVVVTGHVDDARQGTGFAQRFSSLQTGAEVVLKSKDGAAVRYRVSRTASVSKKALPTDALNRQDGPETLILVTCGGEFVGPPLGYAANDIVYAVRD